MATKLTADEVINFIWSGACTPDARRRIVRALNDQRKVAATQAASHFCRNDKVEFTNKRGKKVQGTIDKVNRVTIYLTATDGQRWRVSPDLLTRV